MRKRFVLGAAVKAIREAKALPAARFATDCGMSPSHLCNIEKGRRQAPLEVIDRIAAALGEPIEAISYEVEIQAAVAA